MKASDSAVSLALLAAFCAQAGLAAEPADQRHYFFEAEEVAAETLERVVHAPDPALGAHRIGTVSAGAYGRTDASKGRRSISIPRIPIPSTRRSICLSS